MSSLVFFPPPAAPATLPHLKLFGDPSERVGPHSTLREAFEVHVLPRLDERSPATLVEYWTTLAHWERLTENGPVGWIDREAVKRFRQRLVDETCRHGRRKFQRSSATVNKIMRTLRAMIAPLWPADRHNPEGRGLVPYCGFPTPLPRQKRLPFVFSRRELSALYLSAEACRPTGGHRRSGLHLPILWRTALVLALNTGPRTWDLFALRWEDVRWDDFRYGAVFYRARKTAKLQRPPLNRVARAHLEHVRRLGLDHDWVFPGFRKHQAFYAAWRRICAQAGVRAPFEALRKTCSTWHDDLVPGVGAWLTGHAARGVNAEHYQDPTRRVLRAVYLLRNPREFRRGARRLARGEPSVYADEGTV
jgi:integrase